VEGLDHRESAALIGGPEYRVAAPAPGAKAAGRQV